MTEKISDQWQTPADLFNKLNEEFNFDIDLCATKENSKCNIYCTDYLNNKYNILDEEWKADGELVFTSFRATDRKIDGDRAYSKNNVTCFMNPPYSNPLPFITKAWGDSKHCKIVCLMKVDSSTKWWSVFWNYIPYKEWIPCMRCGSSGLGEITGLFPGELPPRCINCHGAGKRWLESQTVGPKPGCELRLLPKRVKFDPPQSMISNGEVWKVKGNWVQKCKCKHCKDGQQKDSSGWWDCMHCKGKGYTALSGPSFPSALIIMDRRNV